MRPTPSAAALVVAFVACLAFPAARAASTVAGQPLDVGPFRQVEVSGHAEVVLVQGDRETVTVEGSPRNPARVRVRSNDGKLRITVDEERGFVFGHGGRTPTVTIAFRTLETLAVSGAVKVQAASVDLPKLAVTATGAASLRIDALRTDDLRFEGSGAVKAEIEGAATVQRVSISGAGTFRGAKLASDDVTAMVSGAGRVIVSARKTLQATISGAGAIDYYGDPAVTQRISGVGKITRRGGEAAAPKGARTAYQCRTAPGGIVSGLNSSGPPVTGSRSACTPPTMRTSATRQPSSNEASIVATSATRSPA